MSIFRPIFHDSVNFSQFRGQSDGFSHDSLTKDLLFRILRALTRLFMLRSSGCFGLDFCGFGWRANLPQYGLECLPELFCFFAGLKQTPFLDVGGLVADRLQKCLSKQINEKIEDEDEIFRLFEIEVVYFLLVVKYHPSVAE